MEKEKNIEKYETKIKEASKVKSKNVAKIAACISGFIIFGVGITALTGTPIALAFALPIGVCITSVVAITAGWTRTIKQANLDIRISERAIDSLKKQVSKQQENEIVVANQTDKPKRESSIFTVPQNEHDYKRQITNSTSEEERQ